MPSNPPTAVPVSGKGPAPKKAPARKPKVLATKKPVTKKVSAQKTEPAKPVVTKSSAKKATAKKTPPLKAKPVKAVVAPPQATRPTVRRSELATSAQAAASESARETAKAKTKLVRDSFTMPQQDFGLIAALKDRALGFKRPAKKSELLRAGLHALQQLTDTQLRGALDSLVPLKAGRPKKKTN
ncbi:hypothetical protein EH244_31985 [Variovorax beijingensis]|uniref:Uncharacterized protein n=1 Tax=Variovorax beijingensis TaxID=2496117 RepID=A0A3P3E1A7_9BURK|nr:hypothetical protein EH244_31985 [Variovorax beijingensis]RSZ29939.1 hypothetical protein EJO66_27740 [Variovorax beijingensis]